jgi:hypothetical protein
MRNMSFALTTDQVLKRTKTVTRRVGWNFLKAGDLIQAVEKGMGLKKGETVKRLAVLRVKSVTGEWMSDFRSRADAQEECEREGFPLMNPSEFYNFFRTTHPNGGLDDLRVNRIEFEYAD